jgi:hypothetical protein
MGRVNKARPRQACIQEKGYPSAPVERRETVSGNEKKKKKKYQGEGTAARGAEGGSGGAE